MWSKLFGGGEGLPREKVDAVVILIEGWTAEQAQEVKGTIPDAASLDKPVSSEDKALRLVDVIVDEMHLDVPDAAIEVIEVTWLREAIQRLPQKARYVLVRRYGLDDRDTLTLAELASELKLSRERVRQLQREAEFLLKSGTRRAPHRSVARGSPSRRF